MASGLHFLRNYVTYLSVCQGKGESGGGWERSLMKVLIYTLLASKDCFDCCSGSFLRKLRCAWLPLGLIITKLRCGVIGKGPVRKYGTLNDTSACLWLVTTVVSD